MAATTQNTVQDLYFMIKMPEISGNKGIPKKKWSKLKKHLAQCLLVIRHLLSITKIFLKIILIKKVDMYTFVWPLITNYGLKF